MDPERTSLSQALQCFVRSLGSDVAVIGVAPVGYRERPELWPSRPSAEERRQQRYVLWLLPVWVVCPNVTRIAKLVGFKLSYEVALCATIAMGVICIVGAIVSYRSARAAAARDLAAMTPKER